MNESDLWIVICGDHSCNVTASLSRTGRIFGKSPSISIAVNGKKVMSFSQYPRNCHKSGTIMCSSSIAILGDSFHSASEVIA